MLASQWLGSLSSRLWPSRPRLVGRRPAPRAGAVPRLESLERRDVPSAFGNQVFVTSLYQGFLGRNPDTGGAAYWIGALNTGGGSPLQVASGILASTEYRGREVATLFQNLLGRPPDLNGFNALVSSMGGGTSLDQVKAAILASDEFFTAAGGTGQGFLNALFQDVLGRAPDAQALSAFGSLADGGSDSRLQVASQVVGGAESQQQRLAQYFQQVLGRAVDPLGQAFWGGALQNGARDEAVLAGLLSSAEFLDRVEAASVGGVDANQVAGQFIASNALFRGGPSATASTPASTAVLVQSPAFGSITFPVGFDASTPGTTVGTFGANGFVSAAAQSGQGASTGSNGTQGTTTGTFNTGTTGNNANTGFNNTGVSTINTGTGFNNTGTTTTTGTGGTTTGVTTTNTGSGFNSNGTTAINTGTGGAGTGVPTNTGTTVGTGTSNTLGLAQGGNAPTTSGFTGTSTVTPNNGIGTVGTVNGANNSFTTG